MRDDAELLLGDADLGERRAAVLAVDDDPVEAGEELQPERGLVRCAPRQEVVRGEHRREMRVEEAHVELGRGEPLHVQDIRVEPVKPGEPERMLRRLERNPQARAVEDARCEWIEQLPPPVAVRRGRVSEAEARRNEVDLGAGAREGRRELVVVRRRESRRVGEQNMHGS